MFKSKWESKRNFFFNTENSEHRKIAHKILYRNICTSKLKIVWTQHKFNGFCFVFRFVFFRKCFFFVNFLTGLCLCFFSFFFFAFSLDSSWVAASQFMKNVASNGYSVFISQCSKRNYRPAAGSNQNMHAEPKRCCWFTVPRRLNRLEGEKWTAHMPVLFWRMLSRTHWLER